ncbi:hypothetical protein JHK86_049975 [Glycine max]|nr:hypothetical protein JHK86_049975 [Glycine max]
MEANGDWEEEAEREENEGSTAFCTDSDNFTAVQHGGMNGGEDSDRGLIETTTVTLLCTGGGGTLRNQAGLGKCIVRAVNACHPHLHSVLYESIILTGGNTLFPQFAERLEGELRPLVPNDYHVKIIYSRRVNLLPNSLFNLS